MFNADKVVVTYYLGSLGPTVQFVAHGVVGIMLVRNVFLDLARSRNSEIALSERDGFHLVGMNELSLQIVKKKSLRKTLQTLDANNGIFALQADRPFWRDCVSKIHALIKGGPSWHQYLTDEAVDDVVVEVSCLEDENAPANH
jgi:hypothetical protein